MSESRELRDYQETRNAIYPVALYNALYVTSDYLIGIRDIDTEDFLADSRINEMLDGMDLLPENLKKKLMRVYDGLAAHYAKGVNVAIQDKY